MGRENGPARFEPDAFNVVATMRARLRSVTIAEDLVTIDYHVPDGDWGVNGSASLRALVQQLVFTASEEPGIVRVLITQNGEADGPSLVVSSAAPRGRGVARPQLNHLAWLGAEVASWPTERDVRHP